jgi:hypothetical protein
MEQVAFWRLKDRRPRKQVKPADLMKSMFKMAGREWALKNSAFRAILLFK